MSTTQFIESATTKQPITHETIPEEDIETHPHHSKRYWYPRMYRSAWQHDDVKYARVKQFLIDFYTTWSMDKLLYLFKYGTEEGSCPITMEHLSFVRSGCGDCGVMYEVPQFHGRIFINDRAYTYQGHINGERWCESVGYGERKATDKEMRARIKSDDFLFKLYIDDGPFMFIHTYSAYKHFRIGKWTKRLQQWNTQENLASILFSL